METTTAQFNEDYEYYRAIFARMNKDELVDLLAWDEALNRARLRKHGIGGL